MTLRLLVICLAFGAGGCVDSAWDKEQAAKANRLPVKPFVIINKDAISPEVAVYYYIDKNYYRWQFEDYISKYSIGDTIK